MDHWFLLAVISVTCLLPPLYSAATAPAIKCPSGLAKVPNPQDCESYYICAYGKPRIKFCPADLEWNAKTSKCEEADVAGCTKKCDPVAIDPHGTWDPPSCSADKNSLENICTLKCNTDYQLKGSSSIVCKDYGWNSTNGDAIPKCVDPICLSQDMSNAVNYAMTECDGMLFVLDESGSIGKDDFEKSKVFVSNLISNFTLSTTRTAGLITFDDDPIVRIPLTESSTASFKARVNQVPYRGQGTLVLKALQRALQEIQTSRPGKRILVILVTDGESEDDATPGANALKNANHPVLTIGIGHKHLKYVESLSSIGENGIRHFFYARDYEILKSISYYMGTPSAAAQQVIKQKCGTN